MTDGLVVIVIAAGFAVALLVRSARIVPPGHADVLERFGRYHRTLSAGLNLTVPFIDLVRCRVVLGEQEVKPRLWAVTRDNVDVSVETEIRYQAVDPAEVQLAAERYRELIEEFAADTARAALAPMDLEHARSAHWGLADAIRQVLEEATARWGMRVHQVLVTAINPGKPEG
jgi:regulator of protease activity HflC (stomatin/prohibitin superfamily)